MRDSTYRFNLDIHDIASQVQITAKQNDNARKIILNLMEQGKPYKIARECRAVMMIKKPDGTILYNDCDVIDKGSAVSYDFTVQTSAVVGLHRCELRVYGESNQIVTSPRFTILVCSNVYEDGQVSSTSEYTALTEALSDVVEFKAAVEDAVERVDKALLREEEILNKAENYMLSAKDSSEKAKVSEINSKESEINSKDSEVWARYYADSLATEIEEINKKLGFAEFNIDDNGNLIYTDNSPYVFGVNEEGNLTWEVII